MNYMQFIDKIGADTKPKIIFEKLIAAGITTNTAGKRLKLKDIYDYRARSGKSKPREYKRQSMIVEPRRPGRPRGSYKKKSDLVTIALPSQKAFLIYAEPEIIKQILGVA